MPIRTKPSERRECPICGGEGHRVAYPYSTFFAGTRFDYTRCQSCRGVYVDPLPDSVAFALMYSKANYHDLHYLVRVECDYERSANFLRRFARENASVLDYGCGLGGFLTALKHNGFIPAGVEYDEEAAQQAWKNTGCRTLSLDEFGSAPPEHPYDVLHLGDVIAHLPEPRRTLKGLLEFVKPGGLVFAEGPLQNNPSLVYWAAMAFGCAKRMLRRNFAEVDPPTHLFRADEKQHLLLFRGVEPRLELLHWEVFETGWPYANGAGVRKTIASMATLVSGVSFLGMTFGNRFRGVFRTPN
jgi:2-polyprenyl-3-methyl-5-hydroxy-6-metoxy-1,4-benzoquinol methylase